MGVEYYNIYAFKNHNEIKFFLIKIKLSGQSYSATSFIAIYVLINFLSIMKIRPTHVLNNINLMTKAKKEIQWTEVSSLNNEGLH